jgi:hypothetical protein
VYDSVFAIVVHIAYLPVSMRSYEQQLSDIPLVNATLIDRAKDQKSCRPNTIPAPSGKVFSHAVPFLSAS